MLPLRPFLGYIRHDLSAASRAGQGIAWGVYPSLAATQYLVDVYVNGHRVDHKEQNYPPHGYINPVNLRSGAQVSVMGQAKAPGGVLNYGLLCRSA